MTPCINIAKKANITYTIHEYHHDPSAKSYGDEVVEKLGIPASKVFKTLVVKTSNDDLAVAVVPVSTRLNMKLIAKATKSKKACMAEATEVERTTGYILGGVSPLGQKKKLKTIIDISARDYPTIFISAGRRGLEIELTPQDLARLTQGIFAQVS